MPEVGAEITPTGAVCLFKITIFSLISLLLISSPVLSQTDDQGIDLNLFNIPTDLVAAVVSIEDDIVISNLLQSPEASTESSRITKSTPVLTPSVTEPLAVEAFSDDSIDTDITVVTLSAAELSPPEAVLPDVPQVAVVDITQKDPSPDPVMLPTVDPLPGTTDTATTPQVLETALITDNSGSLNTESPITESIDKPETEMASVTLEVPQTSEVSESAPSIESAISPIEKSEPSPATAVEPAIDETRIISSIESVDTITESVIEQPKVAPVVLEQVITEEQEQRINEDEIILAWAIAWSNNDIDGYLSFYDEKFIPSDKNVDRADWEQLRRKRLKNENIRIIVSNAEVYRVEGDLTEIRFTQRYTSLSYRDRVIKSIEMVDTPNGWKFVSERTVEKLEFK